MAESISLTLYGRKDCHLCQEMERDLAPLSGKLGFSINYLDVDAAPDTSIRYGEFVPVLLDGEVEITRYRLDIAKLRDYLAAKP